MTRTRSQHSPAACTDFSQQQTSAANQSALFSGFQLSCKKVVQSSVTGACHPGCPLDGSREWGRAVDDSEVFWAVKSSGLHWAKDSRELAGGSPPIT